jgi:hypothetical protein
MSPILKIASLPEPPDRPPPQFTVGQRVKVIGSAFTTARRGKIAQVEWRRRYAADGPDYWWGYWLQDGGLFSANELEAD